ncbi:hypothetical protein HDF16_004240 [Granulicella aggregans]|uniref:Uncharacterized protein n=1 Tax=Granulicella aggregans TaxID=474949 RepID=A0A7W7ZGJ1_9BACT|nr:hypothetical protein [Granulicella aggregans]MBB5059514.1 hypothetical protein [Granulicella aggregans]
MLPFDRRPWAKTLATVVIACSLTAAVTATYFLYSFQELHIPEIAIILLLLLTIIPPNVEIVLRKKKKHTEESSGSVPVHHLRTP